MVEEVRGSWENDQCSKPDCHCQKKPKCLEAAERWLEENCKELEESIEDMHRRVKGLHDLNRKWLDDARGREGKS